MPKVDGKEFPYTDKGKKAAKKFAKKKGKKVMAGKGKSLSATAMKGGY